jgi:hypothetical protein
MTQLPRLLQLVAAWLLPVAGIVIADEWIAAAAAAARLLAEDCEEAQDTHSVDVGTDDSSALMRVDGKRR